MKFLVVDANVIFSCLLKGKAFENIFQAKIGIRDFLKRQRKYIPYFALSFAFNKAPIWL